MTTFKDIWNLTVALINTTSSSMKQGAIIVEFSDFKVLLTIATHLDAET
jgi:hypothetical protein